MWTGMPVNSPWPAQPNSWASLAMSRPVPGTSFSPLGQPAERAETSPPTLWDTYVKTPRPASLPPDPLVSGETPQQQQMMLRELYQVVPEKTRPYLKKLEQGTLWETSGDDNHTTLYYLHQMATTPRAEGLDPVKTAQETIELLAKPYKQKQAFTIPDFNRLQQLLALQETAGQSPHNFSYPSKKRHWWDVLFAVGNNCVSATVIQGLIRHQPKEVARFIAEASSPRKLVTELATAEELDPKQPITVENKLRGLNLAYETVRPGVYRIGLHVPDAGVIRASAAQNSFKLPISASGVEVLLQTTLAYNATGKTYDPAVDKRSTISTAFTSSVNRAKSLTPEQKRQLLTWYNQAPRLDEFRDQVLEALDSVPNLSAYDKRNLTNMLRGEAMGLSDEETLFVKKLIEDGQSFTTVPFQIDGVPAGSYYHHLYGHVKPLDQLTEDLAQLVQASGGLSLELERATLWNGQETAGHDVFISHAEKRNGEWVFIVANTDISNWNEAAQKWPARKLIPRVRHVVLPYGLAQQFYQSMAPWQGQVIRPSANDKRRYDLLNYCQQTFPDDEKTPYQEYIAGSAL